MRGVKSELKAMYCPPAGERRGGKSESQSQLRRHDQQPLSLAAKHVGGKSRSHQPRSSNAMSLVGHTAAESSESEEGEGMDLAALKAYHATHGCYPSVAVVAMRSAVTSAGFIMVRPEPEADVEGGTGRPVTAGAAEACYQQLHALVNTDEATKSSWSCAAAKAQVSNIETSEVDAFLRTPFE